MGIFVAAEVHGFDFYRQCMDGNGLVFITEFAAAFRRFFAATISRVDFVSPVHLHRVNKV
jgi:hypothetical protein